MYLNFLSNNSFLWKVTDKIVNYNIYDTMWKIKYILLKNTQTLGSRYLISKILKKLIKLNTHFLQFQ